MKRWTELSDQADGNENPKNRPLRAFGRVKMTNLAKLRASGAEMWLELWSETVGTEGAMPVWETPTCQSQGFPARSGPKRK